MHFDKLIWIPEGVDDVDERNTPDSRRARFIAASADLSASLMAGAGMGTVHPVGPDDADEPNTPASGTVRHWPINRRWAR